MFPYLLYYKDWGFICLQNDLKKILKQDLSTDETMQAHEFSVTLSYLQD